MRTICSVRSTRSSVRWPRRSAARCACSPVPAPGRPVPSPTGSPTAWPAGVYNPTEVLAVTFTTRAAGEMRTRLRSMGAAAVQARTFHSAALRQVRYFWPKVYGGAAARADRVQDPDRRRRRPPQPRRGRARPRCATWPARSSGPRSATSAPTTTSGSPPAAGARSAGLDAGTVAHVFGSYEELKRDQGRMDMEDVLLIGGRAAQRGRAGRRGGAPSVQVVRRRRVPGRQPDPVRPCSTCGSAAATRSAWSATRRRRSTPSPGAQADLPDRLPGAVPGHRPASSWCATTAPPPRSIEAANALLKGAATSSVQLRAQREAGPAVTWQRGQPTRSPRREAVAAEIARLPRRRRRPARDGGAVPHQRTVGGVRGGAHRPRASPTSSAARPGSSSARRSARRVALLRGQRARRARRRRTDLVGPRARRAHRHGVVDRGSHRSRPGPGPVGVAAGAGLAGGRPRGAEVAPTDLGAASSPSSTGAPTSSTPRSRRA